MHNERTLHSSVPAGNNTRAAIGMRFASPQNILYPKKASGHGLDLSKFGAILVSGSGEGCKNRLLPPPMGESF